MASVVFLDSDTQLDYSVVTGEPKRFVWHGHLLLDRATGFDFPGWQNRLAGLAIACGLVEDSGMGLRAWVNWLKEQGHLQ